MKEQKRGVPILHTQANLFTNQSKHTSQTATVMLAFHTTDFEEKGELGTDSGCTNNKGLWMGAVRAKEKQKNKTNKGDEMKF